MKYYYKAFGKELIELLMVVGIIGSLLYFMFWLILPEEYRETQTRGQLIGVEPTEPIIYTTDLCAKTTNYKTRICLRGLYIQDNNIIILDSRLKGIKKLEAFTHETAHWFWFMVKPYSERVSFCEGAGLPAESRECDEHYADVFSLMVLADSESQNQFTKKMEYALKNNTINAIIKNSKFLTQ